MDVTPLPGYKCQTACPHTKHVLSVCGVPHVTGNQNIQGLPRGSAVNVTALVRAGPPGAFSQDSRQGPERHPSVVESLLEVTLLLPWSLEPSLHREGDHEHRQWLWFGLSDIQAAFCLLFPKKPCNTALLVS